MEPRKSELVASFAILSKPISPNPDQIRSMRRGSRLRCDVRERRSVAGSEYSWHLSRLCVAVMEMRDQSRDYSSRNQFRHISSSTANCFHSHMRMKVASGELIDQRANL